MPDAPKVLAPNVPTIPLVATPAETARLKRYCEAQDLLCNRAKKLDPRYQKDVAKYGSLQYSQMWIGLPTMICKIAADLVLSKPPEISSDDEKVQERIDALIQRSELYTMCWEALYWTSGLGDGWFVIVDVEQSDGSTKPILSFRRATGVLARNVRAVDSPKRRVIQLSSDLGDGTMLYQVHTAGYIYTRAVKENKEVALPAGFEAVIETKEAVPLVVHFKQVRGNENDDGHGISDFDGTEDFCYEISNRFRQVSKILDRHAEPPMNVPQGTVDEDGAVDPETNKVFERDASGQGAEYVAWAAQLEQAYMEIDKLIFVVQLLSETPPALSGTDKGGQAESGRALMFKLLTALGKARRTGGQFKEKLAQAVRLALRREDVIAGGQLGDYIDIDVELCETFIADEMEKIERIVKLRQAGVISIEEGVEEISDGDADEQAEEVQRIKDEVTGPPAPLGLEANRSFAQPA